ncbi:AAA family ATPase [Porticoccus sp. W117]|uniref:AAA family ATPase n=1 Tax=Porticoccus sp. W117 TaxID=3054777 RepID=UPI0025948D5B|nr:AAA family ATPase [Porticoccus sp. W117]MDM3871798.1 AAA family ATPase [Porticoccus sp. W117]
MPRFQNAVGYLVELRDSVNEPWFDALCDMALNSDGTIPTQERLEALWTYLHGLESYERSALPTAAAFSTAQNTSGSACLTSIHNFSSFKKLSPNLKIEPGKKISLIFGMNGSGKSSLCQAIKVLSNPEDPDSPLHNVHSSGQNSPSFSYSFEGDTQERQWSPQSGFGSLNEFIKYFDSSVALRNVEDSLNPKNSVEVSVFRLELFEYARSLLESFQSYTGSKVQSENTRLTTLIENLKSKINATVNTNVEPFLSWSSINPAPMKSWLDGIIEFGNKDQELASLSKSLEQHMMASSKEGLKGLQAQLALIKQLKTKLSSFEQKCRTSPVSFIQAADVSIEQKQSTLNELSARLSSDNIDPIRFQMMVNHASELTDFSNAKANSTDCPLCRQKLSRNAESLFKAYHEYTNNQIRNEIKDLNLKRSTAIGVLSEIRKFNLNEYLACQNQLPVNCFQNLSQVVEAILNSVPPEGGDFSSFNTEEFSKHSQLSIYVQVIEETKSQIETAIKASAENEQSLSSAIKQLQDKIGNLRAHKTISDHKQEMLAICAEIEKFVPVSIKCNGINFSTMLRNMSSKGKKAYNELVLDSFQEQLDREYIALCGASMEQMGVQLDSRGNRQDVIVTPKIGRSPVHRVLSEGEQKVHSLAVFMCEAEASPNQILVFDDPVTSFDYNYVSNFCKRIRDYHKSNLTTQIIILTHNWDFFVNLQSVLNKAHLSQSVSVQVLENCATAKEYKEKWDDLCSEIGQYLNAQNEPSPADKEHLSGLMRRLIERLTNQFVFNEQRHQYKIKRLAVSEFRKFTKIVPLSIPEADKLGDLYSDLSPSEHDDIRNFYTGISKVQFQTWYQEILSIKGALEARRV